jgi:DHA2 family multidrug resistance protein
VAFLLFLERSLYSHFPIVQLSPFRKPSFVFACAFSLVIGFGLYSSTYLIPLYLGRVRGYDSLQIGETVYVVGCAQLLSTVIAARLAETVDRRIVIAVGLSLFAFSLWLTSHLTVQWGFAALFWPQVLRGLAFMLCVVPSVGMALSAFQGPELQSASGLFNVMRNLGGAIGIAVVNTVLQDNARIETARLNEALGHSPESAVNSLTTLAHRLGAVAPDPRQALLLAEKTFSRIVSQQGLALAFDDVFRFMALLFLFALVMVPFARSPVSGQTAPAETH